MKKYKDRFLRKISNAINVAYLFVAILWGLSTYIFSNDRAELKVDFETGEMTHEEFIDKSKEFSQKEEKMFGFLFSALAINTASDMALYFGTKGKDL